MGQLLRVVRGAALDQPGPSQAQTLGLASRVQHDGRGGVDPNVLGRELPQHRALCQPVSHEATAYPLAVALVGNSTTAHIVGEGCDSRAVLGFLQPALFGVLEILHVPRRQDPLLHQIARGDGEGQERPTLAVALADQVVGIVVGVALAHPTVPVHFDQAIFRVIAVFAARASRVGDGRHLLADAVRVFGHAALRIDLAQQVVP